MYVGHFQVFFPTSFRNWKGFLCTYGSWHCFCKKKVTIMSREPFYILHSKVLHFEFENNLILEKNQNNLDLLDICRKQSQTLGVAFLGLTE